MKVRNYYTSDLINLIFSHVTFKHILMISSACEASKGQSNVYSDNKIKYSLVRSYLLQLFNLSCAMKTQASNIYMSSDNISDLYINLNVECLIKRGVWYGSIAREIFANQNADCVSEKESYVHDVRLHLVLVRRVSRS